MLTNQSGICLIRNKERDSETYDTEPTIDILLRVNSEESHGTAPLGWDIRVCSPPPLSEVGILERGHEGRLQAVPTSRYSYPHPNRVQTRSYFRR